MDNSIRCFNNVINFFLCLATRMREAAITRGAFERLKHRHFIYESPYVGTPRLLQGHSLLYSSYCRSDSRGWLLLGFPSNCESWRSLSVGFISSCPSSRFTPHPTFFYCFHRESGPQALRAASIFPFFSVLGRFGNYAEHWDCDDCWLMCQKKGVE